jgi:type I restriction enzyme S subunit
VIWKQTPLGYCVTEVKKKNAGGREENLLSLSYGNIIRRDIATADGLLPESFDSYNVISPGDTVLRLTDLQNDQRSLRVGLVEEVGIITSAYVTIRPSKVVHPKFLNYFLKHMDFRKDFYALGAGVRQSLKFDELRSVKVPVPTLTEQKVIVDYLDRETARIDALIEKKQRMMGLASELVGSKIESVLNSFVANCPRPSLAYVLSAQITDGPHETPEFVESGVPFLSVDNIQNSQIDFEHTRFISSEENARFSRKSKPIFGDVLLTKAASVGKVALVATDVEFNIWSPIAILRPNRERLTPEYLWWLFRSPRIQMQLQLYATSSTQQNISMRDLSSIRLDVPSLDVQGVCVSQLNKVDAWSRNLLEKMVKDKELLIERRQALITAAVTGELEIPGVAA